ncbi:hypothetical protein CTEN210_12897 [Chaetoceros tenuissimus]|uniref:LNR domain-containing protein n=1 Tax=Chaetoceros tenuissimus TaxID=426638 RepID=A0AAD3D462_9STRA|nr:hypothetical protein CTEN210_12897 [Chaetoceros tenuissimus]
MLKKRHGRVTKQRESNNYEDLFSHSKQDVGTRPRRVLVMINEKDSTEWGYYPNCTAPPTALGNSHCDWEYNDETCGYDGGDCDEFNAKYPKCKEVDNAPNNIGNGYCNHDDGLNIEECGWDGGDCLVDGYPDCHVQFPHFIENGVCDYLVEEGSYNSKECGFDGGDCLFLNEFLMEYPNCYEDRIENVGKTYNNIGDGKCDGFYNTKECNWEGGDCDEFNLFLSKHPNCTHIPKPYLIGNNICNSGDYNTPECGWDDGDCLSPAEKAYIGAGVASAVVFFILVISLHCRNQ